MSDILVIPDGNRRWAERQGFGFDAGYQQLPITISMMNYTTADDLQRAIAKGVTNVLENMDEPANIDVILRTGGRRRLSGFTPIRSPNAEIIFAQEFFPDLTPVQINFAVYAGRNRQINDGR